MDDLTTDAAIAAAVMIVDLIQTSPGATTPELVSQIVVIVGEAIKAAAVFQPRPAEPSAN